jgi:hypothetical protein
VRRHLTINSPKPSGLFFGAWKVALYGIDVKLTENVGIDEDGTYRFPTGFLCTAIILNIHSVITGEAYLLPTLEDVLWAMENGIDQPICFFNTGIDPIQLKALADILDNRDRRWRPPLRASARGRSRSCAAATSTNSSCCRSGGSSNVPSDGSAGTDARPAISSGMPHRRGLRAYGNDPHHAVETGSKALSVMQDFPDGFSGD